MTVYGIGAAVLATSFVLGYLRRAAMERAYAAGTGGGYAIWVMWIAACFLVAVGVVATRGTWQR